MQPVMAKKIKVGIIGTGQIGKSHVRNYQGIPEAEIVAVCDLRKSEAKRVAKENDIPVALGDYHELLAMDDIDAVDVCLHNRLHAPITIDALEAGKHVFCEKPMASSYAEAKRMYATARKRRRKLSIQLNTLFQPDTRAAKRLIDDGHLGDIYYVKTCHYRRRGRPFVDGYGTNAFVQTKTAAGGAMLDMAVYHISRILYLLGNPDVVSVSGNTHQDIDMYADRRRSSGYDVEELGMAYIRLKGGISMWMEEAWAIHQQDEPGSRIMGAKGGLKLDPLSYYTTTSDLEMDATFDVAKADWRWHQCVKNYTGFDSPQHNWIWGLLGRVPLVDTAAIARATAQITEGVYASARLGREVTAREIETGFKKPRAKTAKKLSQNGG
jgi:predicted dehydrogenase